MATKKKARTRVRKSEKKLVATDLFYDWRESPELDDLRRALKPFGIIVTEDPACEGQDAYGFIFSNRPLTEEELQEWAERC